MTQADNAQALRMSLDSKPTQGKRQARVTATTPLPKGWAYFCSSPDSKNRAHWYATAPWDAYKLHEQYGEEARGLVSTVSAPTWPKLHAEVRAQMALYASLSKGEAL